MKENPELLMSEIFTFLNIANDAKINFEVKNESGLPRFVYYFQKLLQRITLPSIIKNNIPYNIHPRIKNLIIRKLNVKPYKYPKMNSKTRSMLRSYYKEEIKKLEKLLNVDLSKWN